MGNLPLGVLPPQLAWELKKARVRVTDLLGTCPSTWYRVGTQCTFVERREGGKKGRKRGRKEGRKEAQVQDSATVILDKCGIL